MVRRMVLVGRKGITTRSIALADTSPDILQYIERSYKDPSLIIPCVRKEVEVLSGTYTLNVEGERFMMGVHCGTRTTLLGYVRHPGQFKVTRNYAIGEGEYNWYDQRVRTMRNHKGQCRDCAMVLLFCCRVAATEDDVIGSLRAHI